MISSPCKMFNVCIGTIETTKPLNLPNDPVIDPLMDLDNNQAIANGGTRVSRRKKKKSRRRVQNNHSLKDTESFECDYCNLQFPRKCSLSIHVKKCYRQKTQGPRYNLEYRLWYNRKIRVDKKCVPLQYRCTVCNYRGKDKLMMQNHVVDNHSSTVPYKCTMCEEGFKLKIQLKQHMYDNHYSVPESCIICGQFYKNKSAMRLHMKNTHDIRNLKSIVYTRNVSTENNLEQNMLCNEEIEQVACHLCNMTFKRKKQLLKHMQDHDERKPYSCIFCNKSFRTRFDQEQHVLKHTTLKPYACSICGVSFSQRWRLWNHRKTHPGPLPPMPKVFVGKLIMDHIQELQVTSKELQGNQERMDSSNLFEMKEEMLD